jgi:hypothetical protein
MPHSWYAWAPSCLEYSVCDAPILPLKTTAVLFNSMQTHFDLQEHPSREQSSDNSLQFPRIAQRILNRNLTNLLDLPLRIHQPLVLLRKVYAPIDDLPFPRLRELDHRTLAIQEQEILRRADGQRWVCFLRTGCDFVADLDC